MLESLLIMGIDIEPRVRLEHTPTNEEMSALLTHRGAFLTDKGVITVTRKPEKLLFNEDPPLEDSLDFLGYHLFHQRPLYGQPPYYNYPTRRFERNIVLDPLKPKA